MRCTDCIDHPPVIFAVSNQRPDTDDRVIDVLGEFVSQEGANFFVALPSMACRNGEAFEVRDRLDVPNDDVAHPPIGPAGCQKSVTSYVMLARDGPAWRPQLR